MYLKSTLNDISFIHYGPYDNGPLQIGYSNGAL